jgi:hypothetical protein
MAKWAWNVGATFTTNALSSSFWITMDNMGVRDHKMNNPTAS